MFAQVKSALSQATNIFSRESEQSKFMPGQVLYNTDTHSYYVVVEKPTWGAVLQDVKKGWRVEVQTTRESVGSARALKTVLKKWRALSQEESQQFAAHETQAVPHSFEDLFVPGSVISNRVTKKCFKVCDVMDLKVQLINCEGDRFVLNFGESSKEEAEAELVKWAPADREDAEIFNVVRNSWSQRSKRSV